MIKKKSGGGGGGGGGGNNSSSSNSIVVIAAVTAKTNGITFDESVAQLSVRQRTRDPAFKMQSVYS
jgi:hypothetical protein